MAGQANTAWVARRMAHAQAMATLANAAASHALIARVDALSVHVQELEGRTWAAGL